MTTTTFTESQYQNIYPEGINNFYWNKARNKIILNVIRKLFIKEPIVEVGCGRGAVVSFLNQQKLRIVGYEKADINPFKDVKDIVHSNIDVITDRSCIKEKFKSLLLLDVIEHIENPRGFIETLLVSFPEVEKILITVPSCQELFSNYDDYCGHFLRYNPDDVNTLAESLSLKVCFQSYFFHGLYPPARLLKILGKNRNTTIQAPKSTFSKVKNNILASLFYLDYKLLPKNMKGSSIIAVLER